MENMENQNIEIGKPKPFMYVVTDRMNPPQQFVALSPDDYVKGKTMEEYVADGISPCAFEV